jgi:hypothetical protein
MACTHLATAAPDVTPDSTEGCSDCVREGSQWVHLRLCLECGHVACCDNSPAQARHGALPCVSPSGHPQLRTG